MGPANLLQSVPFATAHLTGHPLAGDRRAGAADRARASPCAPDVAAGTSVWWLVPLAGAMSVASSLPWIASQLSPDVFTGVLVSFVLALLIFVPDQSCLHASASGWWHLPRSHDRGAHLSHVLLALLLPGCAAAIPPWLLHGDAQHHTAALAAIALMSVNLLAFDRASLAPFGNMFLLTRVIYDGPGMDALRHDCPASGWRLCAFIDRMPAIEKDDFLWRHRRSSRASRWCQAAVRRGKCDHRCGLARRTKQRTTGLWTELDAAACGFRHR